jgi:hypothetical protein
VVEDADADRTRPRDELWEDLDRDEHPFEDLDRPRRRRTRRPRAEATTFAHRFYVVAWTVAG